jgi:hypothetical protein
LLLIGIYFLVAALASIPPFRGASVAAGHSASVSRTSSQRATTGAGSSPGTSPSPASSPGGGAGGLPAGVQPLIQILGTGLADPATECPDPATPPVAFTGLVASYACTDPTLPGGTMVAFQFDTQAHYEAAWKSFNNWATGGNAQNQSACPPTNAKAVGVTSWHLASAGYPVRTGQVLYCTDVGTSETIPSYFWSIPTQLAFVKADAADHSSFSAMDTWFNDHAPPQAVASASAPTPSP